VIDELNKNFEKEKEDYTSQKEKLRETIAEHEQVCAKLIPAMKVQEVSLAIALTFCKIDEKHYWIALDWLQRWVRGDIEISEVKEIDNTSLRCEHDQLGLANLDNMKCISKVRCLKKFSRLWTDEMGTMKEARECEGAISYLK
jgi:hypothetical protein